MKKHYIEMDKLRGIAICMVLLYHSIIVFPINLHEIVWCSTLHFLLWKIEMPLFFLVSGFCAFCGKQYGSYLKKKVQRILVPHIVFGLLDIVPRIISNPFVNEQMSIEKAIQDFLLYGGSDWFLWTLFLLFLFFPVLERVYATGPAGKIILLIESFILYFVSDYVTGVFLLNLVAEFQIYFVMGYIVRQEIYEKQKEVCLRSISVLVAGMVLMVFLPILGWVEGKNIGMLLFVIAGGVVFLWLAEKSNGMIGRFFCICGRYSLQMYLLGGYALVASRTLLVSILEVDNPYLIIGGNFVLDLILTISVTHFMIRPNRWICILCGLPWNPASNVKRELWL